MLFTAESLNEEVRTPSATALPRRRKRRAPFCDPFCDPKGDSPGGETRRRKVYS